MKVFSIKTAVKNTGLDTIAKQIYVRTLRKDPMLKRQAVRTNIISKVEKKKKKPEFGGKVGGCAGLEASSKRLE